MCNMKDIYNFIVGEESIFSLSLDELSGNVNVMIVDENGEWIFSFFN